VRPTSPHGSSAKRPNGYVLLEAAAVMAVLGVGGVALLSEVNSCVRSIERQSIETTRIVKDRNARAKELIEDVESR